MICLDTNYLILGLVADSSESQELRAWAAAGEVLVTPMVAWYEFLCGPVSPVQRDTMRTFLQALLLFDEPQAHIASELFNATGRRRALRVDAMIAAAAISAGASLATNNREDFEVFVRGGLRLQPAA